MFGWETAGQPSPTRFVWSPPVSLSATDVQQVLAVAILDAKLASSRESAAGFAATLAPALTHGLNLIRYDDQGDIQPAPEVDGNPFMTVFEALKIRDAVAAVISQAEPTTEAYAEALLNAGYIDIVQLLHTITSEPTPSESDAPRTGQHAVSSDTGLVTAVGTPD